MQAPTLYAEYLSEHQYHPRSSAHSNALCGFVLDDLLSTCPGLGQQAAAGELVYDLNFRLRSGASDWNIDLVLGTPPDAAMPSSESSIRQATPSSIRVAVELKSLMTEHGKAARNRLRDFDAFHSHLHSYDAHTVAAGLIVINQSRHFHSPLRARMTVHRDPKQLVQRMVDLYRSLPLRTSSGATGLDAFSVIVLDYSNEPASPAQVVREAPAPQIGDPLHYRAFVENICNKYSRYW